MQPTFSKHGLRESFADKGRYCPATRVAPPTKQEINTTMLALPTLCAIALEDWYRSPNWTSRNTYDLAMLQLLSIYPKSLNGVAQLLRDEPKHYDPELYPRQDQLAEAKLILSQGKPLVIRGLSRQGKTTFAKYAAKALDPECIILPTFAPFLYAGNLTDEPNLKAFSKYRRSNGITSALDLNCGVIEGLHRLDHELVKLDVPALLIVDEFNGLYFNGPNKKQDLLTTEEHEITSQLLNEAFQKLRLAFIVHKTQTIEDSLANLFGKSPTIWPRPLSFYECVKALNDALRRNGSLGQIAEGGLRLLTQKYGHNLFQLFHAVFTMIATDFFSDKVDRYFFYDKKTIEQFMSSNDVQEVDDQPTIKAARFGRDDFTAPEWDLLLDLAIRGPQSRASLPLEPFTGLRNTYLIHDFGDDTFGIDGEILRKLIIKIEGACRRIRATGDTE